MENLEGFRRLSDIFLDDALAFKALEDGAGALNATHRRGFVRATFAYFEGAVYELKRSAALNPMWQSALSIEEMALIDEVAFEMSEQGQVRRRKLFIPLKSNLRFAYRILARLTNLQIELKTDGQGWEAFSRAIEIRNRLTHPKSTADLAISDDDFDSVRAALLWFFAEFTSLMNGISESFRNATQRLNEQAAHSIEKTQRLIEKTQRAKDLARQMTELSRQFNVLSFRIGENTRRMKELHENNAATGMSESYREEAARLLNEKAMTFSEAAKMIEARRLLLAEVAQLESECAPSVPSPEIP